VRDWSQRLREQLAGMRLDADQQEEIIAELAGHLEDVYENFLEQGICAEKAEEQAWREVSNGRELSRRIRRAKQGEEEMNNRTKQIWMPGLVTAGLATLLLAILENSGVKPTVVSAPAEIPTIFYMPWLLSLPVFGFVGAHWSRRAGGGTGARIIAGIFTSLIFFALPFPLWPLALIVDHGTPTMAVVGWFWCLLNWAVLPCLALLVGALPAALSATDARATSRNPA
jgi:hypothetical protein